MRHHLAVAALVLASCTSSPMTPDSGPATDAPAATCTSAADCDDGLFCNGAEACMPGGVGSNRFGCVAGTSTCLMGQTCNESTNTCTTVCGMTGDADGDGHDAIHCGGDDCDDSDAHRFPGNPEVCDAMSHDEDCDPTTHGARDTDGDGHDDSACCNVDASGTHLCGDDCDDMHAAVHPGAPEICNGIDDDCNGLLDGPSEDSDHDGHANDLCAGAGGSDCNDRYPDVYDGAPELCDGIDSNCSSCDATTQLCTGAGCATPTTRCGDPGSDTTEDADGDAHAPVGATCRGGFPTDDCDDTHAAAHPGGTEICDGLDDDCNGTVDDAAAVTAACGIGATGVTAIGMGCDTAGGTCVVRQCASGHADCNADPSDGCESTLASDVDNCGACAVSCGPGGTCTNGLCDAVVAFDTGDATTCAVRANGTLLCWGRNDYGQLGTSARVTRQYPDVVAGVSGVTEVSAGNTGVCALGAGGVVTCFGFSAFTSSSPLVATHVVSGNWFSCAIEPAGTVACWGTNDHGQLGDGTGVDSESPVRVAGIGDAVAVVTGWEFACALRGNNAITCWGDGLLPTATTTFDLPSAPTDPIDQIAAGYRNVCARHGGSITCWGADDYGQRGDGSTVNAPDVPSTIWTGTGSSAAVDVAIGDGHACFADAGGQVRCWGRNDHGQLGDGTTIPRDTLSLSPVPRHALDLELGHAYSCARVATGSLVCWGDGLNAQTGNGELTDRLLAGPRAAIGVPSIVQGGFVGCSREPDGTAACWGSAMGNVAAPVLSGVVALSSQDYFSSSHTCAVRSDGTAWCFGTNDMGQLGDGTTTDRTSPVQFGTYTDLVQIEGGNQYTCALRRTGEIVCAGSNESGIFGIGTVESPPSPHPTPVPAATSIHDVVEISCGWFAMCARRATGEVDCWGDNGFGALGDGSTVDVRGSPGPVSAIENAAQISVGQQGGCARRASGAVSCWGRGLEGEIGDGATSSRPLPTLVVGLPRDVVDITARGLARCARTRGGSVYCWGANDQGSIGDGTTLARPSPTHVYTDDIVAISGHDRAVCAMRSTGAALCAGWNFGGMLGNGTNLDPQPTPTYVLGP